MMIAIGQQTNCANVATTLGLARILRGASLHVTRPRAAVQSTCTRIRTPTRSRFIGATRTELPTVSHQAVYDVLRALTDAGLMRRIQPSGSVGGRTLERCANFKI